MPLTPIIRPWKRIKMAAAKPINKPPEKLSVGVNSIQLIVTAHS
jgi:hypothetical protein